MSSSNDLLLYSTLNPRVAAQGSGDPRRFILRCSHYPTDDDYPRLAHESLLVEEVWYSFIELDARRKIDERTMLGYFVDGSPNPNGSLHHSWNGTPRMADASHLVTDIRTVSARAAAIELVRRMRLRRGGSIPKFEITIEILKTDQGHILLEMLDQGLNVNFALRLVLKDRNRFVKTPFRVKLLDVSAFVDPAQKTLDNPFAL